MRSLFPKQVIYFQGILLNHGLTTSVWLTAPQWVFCSRRSVDIWMLGARSGMEGWLTEAELRFTWCTLALRERKNPGLHHPKLDEFHVQLGRTRFRCNRLVKTYKWKKPTFLFCEFWSITCFKLGPRMMPGRLLGSSSKGPAEWETFLGWGKSL